jgi:hypothetical protein
MVMPSGGAMRPLLIVLSLCATSAFAQLGAPSQPAAGFQTTWTLGAQSYGPTLTGHFNGIQNGLPINLDLNSDLGLARDKTTPGFFFDYEGTRFGFQVSTGSADYRGNQAVNQTVNFNNSTYNANTQVQSHVKLASVDGTWTIKLISESDAWLGLDLGAQVWTIDMDATGIDALTQTVTTQSTEVKAPIPQIGLSGGTRGYNGAVEAKAYIHYLGYKSATYTLYGVDLRLFPVSWFGLRAFYEGGSLNVPQGSIKDDLEFKLARKGVGLGAVFRF